MARGSKQATTAATSAQNLSSGLQGNARSLYGELAPAFAQEANNPTGIAPADLARMNTAAQQSAGGSEAAAVGQGGLLAARTKNAGAAQNAIAQSARSASQTLGKEAVGIQNQNAMAKLHERQAGLSGLSGLYGEDLGSSIGALGQVAPNVNANTNAAGQSWDWAKYLLDPAMAAGGSAAGAMG